ISKKNVSIATPLVLGVLVLVVCLWLSEDLTDYKHILPKADVRKSVIQPKPPTRSSTYEYSWTKCQQNTSAAIVPGFSSLPHHIQDFLYYHHSDGSAEVFLLLIIKSSPVNYDRREVLRKTWAKERLQNGVWIRRLFISGTRGDGYEKKRLNKLLKLEQRENNDILQWDFSDTFYNLTLKQILFLEWMDRNCPHVRFLFNGDDDVLGHTDNMVAYLKNLKDNDGGKHLFTGHLIQYVGPVRSPGTKYYIPVQVQESEFYPPYCGGGGFLLSGYTAHVIYSMSHTITILPIDDVYMGMCMAKAGLGPASHAGVKTAGLPVPANAYDLDPCYFREVLLVHRFLPLNMYFMWNKAIPLRRNEKTNVLYHQNR
uniref:Hexosyltransferase n=1 Tax=Amphiprion percula TaxID=161767 RepID=A0A3P8SE01_AMPPE